MNEESHGKALIHELKSLNALAAGISHDHSSDVRRLFHDLPPAFHGRVESVLESAVALEDVTTRAFEVASLRSDTGFLGQSQVSEFLAASVGEEGRSLQGPLARQHNVTLDIGFIDNSDARIRGTFMWLYLILQNLVINAIKYGKPVPDPNNKVQSGVITVTSSLCSSLEDVKNSWTGCISGKEHHHVVDNTTEMPEVHAACAADNCGLSPSWFVCTVEDHGQGMDAGKLATIFDPNHVHVPTASDVPISSTGIGLATTCRLLLEKLQGMIGVASTVLGGSRFFFAVPVQYVEPSAMQVDAEETSARTTGTLQTTTEISRHFMQRSWSSLRNASTKSDNMDTLVNVANPEAAPGYGTSFTVVEDDGLSAFPPLVSTRSGVAPPLLLLADDNSSVRKCLDRSITTYFRQRGMGKVFCQPFSSGKELIDFLTELASTPDQYNTVTGIVIDVQLGDDDGRKVCKKIRSQEHNLSLQARRIILMSGDPLSHDEVTAAGADGFCLKDPRLATEVLSAFFGVSST